MESQPPLSSFAPFIQLWAGICAICFYDNLIKRLIGTKKRKQLSLDTQRVLNYLQGMMEWKQDQIKVKIDETLIWFKTRVKHLGRLACCIWIALLLMGGIESKPLHTSHYILLLIAAAVFASYCVFVMEHKGLRYIQRPWVFIWPTLLVYAIVLTSFFISYDFTVPGITTDDMNLRITVAILAIMSFPLLYIICTFYIEDNMVDFRLEKIKTLTKELQIFGKLQSMGIWIYSPEFSIRLRKMLKKTEDPNEKQRLFEQYISDRIDEIFNHGTPWRYRCLILRKRYTLTVKSYARTHQDTCYLPHGREIRMHQHLPYLLIKFSLVLAIMMYILAMANLIFLNSLPSSI